MKIHQIRNATCIIESSSYHILVDPMLGEKGSIPPFSFIEHKARKNPLVDLPEIAGSALEKVTHCLVTHSQKWGIEALTHTDHFDPAGRQFLKDNNIPVCTGAKDASYMRKHGLEVVGELIPWQTQPFLNGSITAVPALHGHTWTSRLMANGIGFFIELEQEPSVYISGDTVYTNDVKKALTQLKPDIAVVAAGSAGLDVGGPILMTPEELTTFIETAPENVVANHMDALNHCPTTRETLRRIINEKGLPSKVFVPEDGETLSF